MGQCSSSHSSSDEFWLPFPRRAPSPGRGTPRPSPGRGRILPVPSSAARQPGCQGCWGGDLGKSRPGPAALLQSASPAQRGAGGAQLSWAGMVKTVRVKLRMLLSRRHRVMPLRNATCKLEECLKASGKKCRSPQTCPARPDQDRVTSGKRLGELPTPRTVHPRHGPTALSSPRSCCAQRARPRPARGGGTTRARQQHSAYHQNGVYYGKKGPSQRSATARATRSPSLLRAVP